MSENKKSNTDTKQYLVRALQNKALKGEMILRLATYNIHWWIGLDNRRDPIRINRVLSEIEADVYALQEVHVEDKRCEELDAAPSRYEVVFGPTISCFDGWYGNALLSRFQVEASQLVDLSQRSREPRGAIIARLRDNDGRPVVVTTTHLGLRPRERSRQLRTLLSAVEGFRTADEVTLLLGDLNEWWPGSRSLSLLRRAYKRGPAPLSFPSRRAMFALDRIFVDGRARIDAAFAHKTPLAREASDHLPVVADVSLDPSSLPSK